MAEKLELEMVQKWKVERLNVLKEELRNYSNFVFTDFRGMNVEQMTSLRKALQSRGVEFHVIKNRFLKSVFNDFGYKGSDYFFINPTALAYFNGDISEVVKLLVNYSKDTTLKLKGGLTESVVLSFGDIQSISELPPKAVLVSQTIGMLKVPVSGLVFILSGILSKFLGTLKAIEKLKGSS